MEFKAWKEALINEIATAAEWRAQEARAHRDDPRLEKSQEALFDLAERLGRMPADHAKLQELFNEENELSNLIGASPGEAENRYHEVKEDQLRAYGIEDEPCEDVDEFLQVLRHRVQAAITEYRLRPRQA